MSSDLSVFMTAAELLQGMRAGHFGSRDVLEAFLDHIGSNAWVNAVVTVDADSARLAADQSDRARRNGAPCGVLHGLPITIKHDIQVGGMLSTYGSEDNAQYVPARDAPAVARLRNAGAIIFGRTNLPEYAADGQSYNALHGTTRNPWDASRTPGGSSGGSAAALAAGMTGLELGSDMGGSIRIPAAWCGVYGFKPSWGVVPATGYVPMPGAEPAESSREADIAVAGPLARGGADIDLAMTVLTGGSTPPSGARLIGPERTIPAARLRVAAWLDDERVPTESHTRQALEDACVQLERAGVTVDRVARPAVPLDDLEEVFELLFMSDAAADFDDARIAEITSAAAADGGWLPAVHARALGLSHREWLQIDIKRHALREEWARFFDTVDVLITPTVITTALLHDHSEPLNERVHHVDGVPRLWRPHLTRWCGAVGAAGLPALSVPAGMTDAGLPVGMQITGPLYGDRTVIAAGRTISDILGGFRAPSLPSR